MAEQHVTATVPAIKTCSCCKIAKPVCDYYKDKKKKDGLYSRCKPCHLSAAAIWSKENKDSVAKAARERRAADPEKHRAYNRGYFSKTYEQNAEKLRARSAENRKKNPSKTNACSAASRAKNPEDAKQYLADYYRKHQDKIKASVRERENRLGDALKPINAEKAMRRVARKKSATPAWANKKKIQSFYKTAARLTAATGIPHHVDHIVPLQSKLVCGLHVEQNLEILLWSENLTKGNRWWPDGPIVNPP